MCVFLSKNQTEVSTADFGLTHFCEFRSRAPMKPFVLYPWIKTITWNAIAVRYVKLSIQKHASCSCEPGAL